MNRIRSFRPPGALFPALAVLALTVSALTFGGCAGEPDAPHLDEEVPPQAPAVDRPVPVVAVTVEARPVVDETTWPADLHPRRRAVLAAEVPGTVETLSVDEGQAVRKGEPLLAVDTRALEQRLAEAEAVDRQRRLQLERATALLERRAITQPQFLDAQTARDVAAARLASARLELENSRVTAPWAGQIAALHVETGDYVSPGRALVELVDTAVLEARAAAPSSDVPFVEVGLQARVGVDVFPEQVFEGEIVRLAAELDPSSRTLEVTVELDNADGLLRPGLAARVRVARRTLPRALTAPLDAVIEIGDGSHAVFVAAGDRAERRAVRPGPVIGTDRVVIEEGLVEGDRLIVEGLRRLSPGQRIAVEPGDGS